MKIIREKKIFYPVSPSLRAYLENCGRHMALPLEYEDLMRFCDSMAVYDRNDEPTYWETVIYPSSIETEIERGLKQIYTQLLSNGDQSMVEHLHVDRVDFCAYANTRPFRIRVRNSFNDNYDHFYIKRGDASRIYGLELEGLLSPSRVNFLVDGATLVEEHIIGIPGDSFIVGKMNDELTNSVRLAKEFIKFNERCFSRLLGDMRSYNYVVNITPDVEDEQYRVRAIDFDQQSFEGNIQAYLPQFFEDNEKIVQLCMKTLNPRSVKQYQREERSILGRRFLYSESQIRNLISNMQRDTLSTQTHIGRLKADLAVFHKNKDFNKCRNMGDLVLKNIETLIGDV